MDNNLKHYRLAMKLTQSELAQRVGTSQQQIQRIENGVTTPKTDLALAIARSVGITLASIFPTLAPNFSKPRGSFFKELTETGGELHTAELYFRGGSFGCWYVSRDVKEQIDQELTSGHLNDSPFFSFISQNKLILVSRHFLQGAQLLIDAHFPGMVWEEGSSQESDDESGIKAWFVDGGEEPRTCSVDSEGSPNEFGRCQITQLFHDATEGLIEHGQLVRLIDDDGEYQFFNLGELLYMEVDAGCLGSAIEDDDEDYGE